MKNILCFGDSNTFGFVPGGGRWQLSERWTGILQKNLGEEYHIIEEGCGGRTTVLEDWLDPGKNGRFSLLVALRSHKPLDLVMIMLGTNDLKHRFSMLPVDIAAGAARLCLDVEQFDYGTGNYPVPKVMLISPIHLGKNVENSMWTGYDRNAYAASLELSGYMKKEAEKHGWAFFDAASAAEPSPVDWLHMDRDNQKKLADALTPEVLRIFREVKE